MTLYKDLQHSSNIGGSSRNNNTSGMYVAWPEDEDQNKFDHHRSHQYARDQNMDDLSLKP